MHTAFSATRLSLQLELEHTAIDPVISGSSQIIILLVWHLTASAADENCTLKPWCSCMYAGTRKRNAFHPPTPVCLCRGAVSRLQDHRENPPSRFIFPDVVQASITHASNMPDTRK
jgi:hypothetical protein